MRAASLGLAVVVALGVGSVVAAGGGEIEIESGALWQERNVVRIPGDGGTRFNLDGLTGRGPFAFARVNASWNLGGRHGLRFVAAPLRISGTGQLDRVVEFAGQTFDPGIETDARYRFDSYRVTWRYRLFQGPRWTWWAGLTAKVRDAEIRLRQGNREAYDDNVGFVPLLHAAGEGRLGERWSLLWDLDAAAASQGRAIDLAAKVRYDLGQGWGVAAGYRTLEGGAENKDVYSFAWLHYAVVSVSRRW